MKRAWFLSCILSLSVVLAGCGKEEPRTHAEPGAASQPPAVSPAQTAQASPQAEGTVQRPASPDEADRGGLATVPVAQLPRQAVATLRLIEAGGPFPFEKDGVVFGNRERMLPRHPRGYYHEYTVPTPRARDRGARRIVCGGARRQLGDCYYTDDHYASFKRIAE